MKNNNAGYIYRRKTGEILKNIRIKKGFTIAEIVSMTGVSRSSIIKVENGTSINIDFMIEYAKAVQYPLANLHEMNIELEPLYPLDVSHKFNLTSTIREHIVKGTFLKEHREIYEIRNELLRKKLIDESVGSTAIAGVMRNLLNEEVVKATKTGRKNLYYK